MPSSPATMRAGPGRPSPPGSPTPTRTRCPAPQPRTAAPRRAACTRVSEPSAREARLPAASRSCRGAWGSQEPYGVPVGGVTETEGQSRTCRLTSWQPQAQEARSRRAASQRTELTLCVPATQHLCLPVYMHWPQGMSGWVGGESTSPTNLSSPHVSHLTRWSSPSFGLASSLAICVLNRVILHLLGGPLVLTPLVCEQES